MQSTPVQRALVERAFAVYPASNIRGWDRLKSRYHLTGIKLDGDLPYLEYSKFSAPAVLHLETVSGPRKTVTLQAEVRGTIKDDQLLFLSIDLDEEALEDADFTEE